MDNINNITIEQQDALLNTLVRSLNLNRRDINNGGKIIAAQFTTSSVNLAKIVIDATNGFQIYGTTGNLIAQFPVQGANAGKLLVDTLQGIVNEVDISSSDGNSDIHLGIGSNGITFTALGGFLFTAHDVELGAGNLKLVAGQDIRESTGGVSIKFNATTIQMFAGATQIAEFSTSNLKLYIAGALRTILSFFDGTHNVLYY